MTRTIVDADGSISGLAVSDAPITPDGVSGIITDRPDAHPYYPQDGDFGDGEDFINASELTSIVDGLIERDQEPFGFLKVLGVRIRVLWKAKGGKSRGKPTCGKCVKLSGLAKFFGRDDYAIWVAADHARDFRWTNLQIEALLYHELRHIQPIIDENLKSLTYGEVIGTRVAGHDDELFADELTVYGAWNDQHARIAAAVNTMRMPLPAGNGAADGQ